MRVAAAEDRVARQAATATAEPLPEVGGQQLLLGLHSALAWLKANQDVVNDLNVFPVPDGDTGSNMYLTLRSAVEDAEHAEDAHSVASVMQAAAHGSLMGARGNSGVILSQILRGFSQGLGGRARADGAAVAAGLQEASAVAYRAVMKPTEGTILTVIREAADAARQAAEAGGDVRTVLADAVREAHSAVERTPELLAVLRDAGVVDAGGFGLAVILEGFSRALDDPATIAAGAPAPERRVGEPVIRMPEERAAAAPGRRGAAAVAAREEGWGYCTEFLIHGPGLDAEGLREELGGLGESALVVGDADLVRVHIHTGEPATLIAAASRRGRLSKLKVEDMTAQHHSVLERADVEEERTGGPAGASSPGAAPVQRKPLGIVSVAPGEGFRDILVGLGCDQVVSGGQTMNPSIEDLLKGVRAANADGVILLPNNRNVILTAEQAGGLAEDVTVRVVPTRNLPQGISAMLALDPGAPLDVNVERMREAVGSVTAVEVTTAVRTTTTDGHDIREGDVIAVVDDRIAAVGDDDERVADSALASLDRTPELITVYSGAGVDEERARSFTDSLAATRPDVEFELHAGGQEHYRYILSVE